MDKTKLIISLIFISGLSSIFWLGTSNIGQTTNVEVLDIPKTMFLIEPKMQLALSKAEKDNLSLQWTTVRDAFNYLKNTAYKINTTQALDSNTALASSRFLNLVLSTGGTIDEIKNELKYPAESVDEKIVNTIGTAVFIAELSNKLQSSLKKNNLEQSGKELNNDATNFLTKINAFKTLFFEAITLPGEQISDDMRKAFTLPINGSDASRFAQYDGRRFFGQIQDTTKQLKNSNLAT